MPVSHVAFIWAGDADSLFDRVLTGYSSKVMEANLICSAGLGEVLTRYDGVGAL